MHDGRVSARRSPYEVVAAASEVRTARKAELVGRVRRIEHAALQGPVPDVAVACLQDGRFLTERTTAVYAELARRGAQVLVLARGLHASVAAGVTAVDLADDDPLGDEWTVLIAGPSSTCFVAQDLLDVPADDADRTFRWAHSSDPDVVARAYEVLSGHVRARGATSLPPAPGQQRTP